MGRLWITFVLGSIASFGLVACAGGDDLGSNRDHYRAAASTNKPQVVKKIVVVKREGSDTSNTATEAADDAPDAVVAEVSSAPAFELTTSIHSAFSAELPEGPEWTGPFESTPNDGLYRTTVDGPDDLTLLIDYTPYEVPVFGGEAESETTISTEHGTATEIVFSGGDIAICEATRCIDYLIEDGSGGGWGVLAGGGDFALAQEVARRVAETIQRYDY